MKIILEIPEDTVEMSAVFVLSDGYTCGKSLLNRDEILNIAMFEPRSTESYFLSARTEETYNSQRCTFDE